MIHLSPDDAREHVLAGRPGPLHVDGRLDLKGLDVAELPSGLHCYELDVSETKLRRLPDDISVECRILLDDCRLLEELPEGLTTGALSLRSCNSLLALPSGLDVWFLDLSACSRFNGWPEHASVNRGSVVLRDCTDLQTLPTWFGTLSQLDLAGCVQLNTIPDGLRVSSWVDVGGTGITALPSSLEGAPLKWRGVTVTEEIAFRPESLTAKRVLAEKNAEMRRVMIERMGYLRFATEAGARVLDEDSDPGGRRQLLRIELEEDEALVGLACSCPSTQRQYLLRVPPATKTCHEAAAWIAGFDDPKLYHPDIET
ncbi:MAG: DUF6745 domain-containing protein [Acidobacteriota bacterium]